MIEDDRIVQYVTRGAVVIELTSALDIERRILRACKTLRALPDPEKKFQMLHNMWPQMVDNPEEAYGYVEATMPRFRPKPRDVSDMLEALSWARYVDEREFRLVWWRSFDLSFKQIGDRLHRSDETARQRYKEVILRMWYEANKAAQRGAAGRVVAQGRGPAKRAMAG